MDYSKSVAGAAGVLLACVFADLTSQNGKAELEKRVSDAASKACNQIQQQYPETTPSVPECTRQAKAGAMAKVQQIEAAAGKTK